MTLFHKWYTTKNGVLEIELFFSPRTLWLGCYIHQDRAGCCVALLPLLPVRVRWG